MGRYILRRKKAPSEDIDYEFDFTDWLAARADTLASFVLDFTPGIEIVSSALVGVGIVQVFVAGGENGKAYDIACDIMTTGGRRKRAVILVRVVGAGIPDGTPIDGGDVDAGYTEPPLDDGNLDV